MKLTLVELKRVFTGGKSAEKVRAEGLVQLAGYLDTMGEDEGWLIIFDQRPGRSWEERLWQGEERIQGRRILLRGA